MIIDDLIGIAEKERAVIPQAVLSELQDPETPLAVVEWIERPRAWLEVRHVTARPEESGEGGWASGPGGSPWCRVHEIVLPGTTSPG